jgi:hypothetical protein
MVLPTGDEVAVQPPLALESGVVGFDNRAAGRAYCREHGMPSGLSRPYTRYDAWKSMGIDLWGDEGA